LSLTNKFFSELADVSAAFANSCYDNITDTCESPIEKIFVVSLAMFFAMRCEPPVIIRDSEAAPSTDRRWFIEPQCHLLGYRADFVVGCYPRQDGKMIVVECDGHDFHEALRSKPPETVREIGTSRQRGTRFSGLQDRRYIEARSVAPPRL
jgi:hypothetical protein